MDIFRVNDSDELELLPWVYSFERFYRIWRRDKSAEKDRARKELSYVYLMTAVESTYMSEDDEDERHQVVRKDLGLPDTWQPDRWLKDAMKLFDSLQNTPTISYLRTTQKTLNTLRDEMGKIDFRTRRQGKNAGKFQRSPQELLKDIEAAVAADDLITKLEQKVVNERQKKRVGDKIRGSAKESNYNTKGNLDKIRGKQNTKEQPNIDIDEGSHEMV